MPSKWSVKKLFTKGSKAAPCQTTTSSSRHPHESNSSNSELTGPSCTTPSSPASQVEANTSSQTSDSNPSILIPNLNHATAVVEVQDTHVTHDKPTSNRHHGIKRFASKLSSKLFTRSHKRPSNPPTPLAQLEEAEEQSVGEVNIIVPTITKVSLPCSRSTVSLVPTVRLEGRACSPVGEDQGESSCSPPQPESSTPFPTRRRSKPKLAPISSASAKVRTSWTSSLATAPPTPASIESGFGEHAQFRQWVNSFASAKNTPTPGLDEHKTIAIATAKYDWDGVIPGRQTRGAAIEKGQQVDICNVVNDNWLHVHVSDVNCMFVPRIYLQIDRLVDERGRQLLSKYLEEPSTPITPRFAFMGEPIPPSLTNKLLASLRRTTATAVERTERLQGKKAKKQKQRPAVPPAPFPREPNDVDHQGNRIMVDTKCQYPKHGGVIMTFTFTLVPALRSRLTSLRFNVKLPGGQKIVGVYPERVLGQQTDVQLTTARTKEVALKASASYAGVGIDIGYGEARIQGVEYSRTIKAEIRGAGKNSDNATWTALEDVAARCGLENKMEFSIMLQTKTPPSKVTCHYMFGVEKENLPDLVSRTRTSFEHTWDVSFLQGSAIPHPDEKSHRARPLFS